jgi:hypothetical protein
MLLNEFVMMTIRSKTSMHRYSIEMYIYSLVCTKRFWNSLHKGYAHNVKIGEKNI